MICDKCQKEINKRQRSTPQNRYLWGVVYEILSDHTGYTVDEVHEICKHKFLRDYIVLAGESLEITRSTTSLTTQEMKDYTDAIRYWASYKLQCSIPEPNEEAQ